MKPKLEWLLVFVPVALFLEFTHGNHTAIFVTSALAILPLAGLIGHATEDLAIRIGPQKGGLLNATMGNVTEMIIAFFLILEGELEIVKASIVGSIIGNVLLVLGLSFLVGGWGRGEQRFNRAASGLHSSSLIIAVIGLLLFVVLCVGTILFGLFACAVFIVDFFVQVSVIPPSLANNETDGIALISQFNPHGVFIVLVIVGMCTLGPVLARLRGEVVAVDGVTPVRRQRHPVARLEVGGARLGVLAR